MSVDPTADSPAEDRPRPAAADREKGRAAPRRVEVPPEPFDPLRAWSSLLIAVGLCAAPLLVELDRAHVTRDEEAVALLRSQETWRRQSGGEALAWLVPSQNGREAVGRGPMTVWLHMAAWSDLDPAQAPPRTLVRRARIVSAAMALLTLTAAYWAGLSIGGVRMARLATMALGTTLLFAYQARLASPDVVLLGWLMLSVGAGLWAIRPLKETIGMGRRVLGWPLAGLAAGAAILTAGPVAMAYIAVPLLAAIAMTPKRRVDNLMGLLFAVLLGLLASMPWHLYVLGRVDDAWDQMARQLAMGDPGTPGWPPDWSHARWILFLSPWQVWLIGALGQPFLRAASAARRQLLIAWLWFLILCAVAAPAVLRDPRFLLPLLPAVGLMVGQLWSYHAQLASERQQDPGVNLLRAPHWVLMFAASIIGPAFIALQAELVDAGRLERIELPGLGLPVTLALGGALLLLALLGARWHFKWRPRLAAYATVVWMVLAMSVCFYAYARSYHSINPDIDDAVAVAQAAMDRPLLYLARTPADQPPDPAFLFYLGRVVRAVTPEKLAEVGAQSSGPCLIVRRDPANEALMAEHGFEPIEPMDFHAGSGGPRRLYRAQPGGTTPSGGDS